jgi:cell division septum initiation protein DivIVA
MSISQSFLPSDTEEVLHPQFTRTLKGFSVAEVDSYVEQAARRIEILEEHLDKALEERDHLRHELASVKSDVYRNAGERLAGILRGIDDHVEGVRRQAEEDAARHLAEARQNAATLRHEADDERFRAKGEAERIVREAHEEAAGVLGELTERRNAVQTEIEGLRGVLLALLERLGEQPSDEPEPVPALALEDGSDADVEVVDDESDEADVILIHDVEPPETQAQPSDIDDDATGGDWIADIDPAVVDLDKDLG